MATKVTPGGGAGAGMSGRSVSIAAYQHLAGAQKQRADEAIDRIFFTSSSVQTFRDDAHRTAFHWLWLGRYLAEEPGEVFVALCDGAVCGYLAGSLADPAPRPEFRELEYFRDFAALTARYPAHLHINIDAGMRSHGIGALLVRRFEKHARAHGCAGVHVVTGAGMRNAGFYKRLGFAEVARTPRNGAYVVMLARDLADSPANCDEPE